MEIVWDWKSIGSLLATMMFLRSAARDFLPPELREFLRKLLSRIFSSLRPTATFIIDELDPSSSITNDLFVAANSYLSSSPSLSAAPVLRLSKTKNSTTLTSALPATHSADEYFRGAHLKWTFHALTRQQQQFNPYSRGGGEQRYLELSFHQRDREMVFRDYLPFVLEEAERLKAKSREKRLYTNRAYASEDHHGHGLWSSVPFKHPSTFDTLAIDPALRDSICSDLLRFSSRRDYYNRVGRAWKRGYLLHGPPGTGKTSLIAAIANFLEFDVYDLELTAVHSNSHLRKLLVSTSPKSVVVVEDVDCSLDLSDRTLKRQKMKPNCTTLNKQSEPSTTPPPSDGGGGGGGGSSSDQLGLSLASTVSLSGVLNFVDGLWSSCVGERLIIFTTNHPERLDPALLRPGRMDRRIELSYCGPAAFRALARNYLEVEGHEKMGEAEGLVEEVEVTPAEIAEVFMGCDGDGADVGMGKMLEELKRKKKQKEKLMLKTGGGRRSSDSDGDGDGHNNNDKKRVAEVDI